MWILAVDFSGEFLVTTSLMDLEEGQKRGGGIGVRLRGVALGYLLELQLDSRVKACLLFLFYFWAEACEE